MTVSNLLPIVMQALPRWDGKYASTSLNLAKELSKTRDVFYVDHPFTVKDRWMHTGQLGVSLRLPIWKNRMSNGYAPFKDFPRFRVISPKPIPVMNFLPKSFLYNWMESYANWSVWQNINQVLSKYEITKFIYINSFDPVFSTINTKKEVALTVYHCVDNISGERYIARHGVTRETELVKKADLVVSTSPALADKFKPLNNMSVCVPNAADYENFNKSQFIVPSDIENIPHPRVLYMGNIGLRIDYNGLEQFAKAHPDMQLVFVGPKDKREFRGQALEKLPNVWFMGAKPYNMLGNYVYAADICLIPFEKNELTKFIYPLKINEYLACGKPVITTRFANLNDFESVIYTYDSPEELYNLIIQALFDNSTEKIAQRKKVASHNTWQERGKLFSKFLDEALAAKNINSVCRFHNNMQNQEMYEHA